MKIDLLHGAGLMRAISLVPRPLSEKSERGLGTRLERYCPSAALATQSEVKARVATSGLCFYCDNQRQAAHRRYKYGQWLRLLQVEQVSHPWHERHQKSRS